MRFTARVFVENVIRNNTAGTWTAALTQVVHGRADADFPFHPASVVLQDLLRTPALVDLAGLRATPPPNPAQTPAASQPGGARATGGRPRTQCRRSAACMARQ